MLRPTFRGASFVFGLGSRSAGKLFTLIILSTLMLMAGPGPGLVLFLQLLAVAVVAGAVAGTVHGALGWMENWGGIGVWLRWALTFFANVVVFGALTPTWPFSLRDPALYVLATGLGVLGATFVMLTDDRRPTRLTPRRFSQLQLRELMWENADRVRRRRAAPLEQEGDPAAAQSADRVRAREGVKEAWIGTIRRSRSRLNWWTRD